MRIAMEAALPYRYSFQLDISLSGCAAKISHCEQDTETSLFGRVLLTLEGLPLGSVESHARGGKTRVPRNNKPQIVRSSQEESIAGERVGGLKRRPSPAQSILRYL